MDHPDAATDLMALVRFLQELSASLRKKDSQEAWVNIEITCKKLADNLRVRHGPVDNHTSLGKTDLAQTLTSLLSLSLSGFHLPADGRVAPIHEILRVGANFCMDHDENRSSLLEVGFPQTVTSLLEGYAENISLVDGAPLPLTLPHLKIVRTSIGLLLNASLNYDPVKMRLISLEAAAMIIKLSSTIYIPTSWTLFQDSTNREIFDEEWSLRSSISNWSWRTVSALKDGQDESLQIINSNILPWITAPLLKFCPPHAPESSPLDGELLATLVQTDFDFLEESCTLIESLSLDVEDFRLELARATCFSTIDKSVACLDTVLDFIEHGSYPELWRNSVFEEAESIEKRKAFDICKAALIKAVVEVFAEEKNEDVLWVDGDPERPGGPFVNRFVQWIKGYIANLDAIPDHTKNRSDMAICASLSLGNLLRKPAYATTLLSPPYSLAPVLSSVRFFSPSTDIKLKHGILGLLKHISQFSKLSSIIPTALANVKILERITSSGIWSEKGDVMADVIQLNAIGVAKHMCYASLDHTIALVVESGETHQTGLSQLLALIKRSDSISIKSEGSRVLVNVVRSLKLPEKTVDASDELQRKRDQCIPMVLNTEFVSALAGLIARSNKYPILVNEGVIANTLLSTHKSGGPLVLESLTLPFNQLSAVDEILSASSKDGSPSPSTSMRNDGLPVPLHALDMLVYALRNVDNPVNFPVEVRVNICTFFSQLQRSNSKESLTHVRATLLPVLEQITIEDAQESEEAEDKLAKMANNLLEEWSNPKSSA